MLSPLMAAFTVVAGVSPANCAEYLLHGLYNAPAGATRYDSHGDDLKGKRVRHNEEDKKALWEHTVKETGVQA